MTGLYDQISILLPALVAGILVLATHIPLGREVLQRGIIFLDLAIAQIASLGVIGAQQLIRHLDNHDGHSHLAEDYHYLWVQFVAVSTAMLGAAGLYAVRHAPAKIQEALIGSLFVLAATAGILLMAHDPYANDHLKDSLVGQILWTSYTQLLWTAIIYVLVLVLWLGFRKRLGEFGFYPLFAITITLSTQLVGVYLVFASLIIPALATIDHKHPYRNAFAIGALGYLVGLSTSAVFDLPTGAMIVWSLAIIAAGVFGLKVFYNR